MIDKTPNDPGFEVHSHAWSARVRIRLPVAEAAAVLKKLWWHEGHSGWRRSSPMGGTRWEIKAAVWSTSRKPSQDSGLGRRNNEWGTKIYNLTIQLGKDGYYLDIGGVRRSDLDRVMTVVLGLADGQWEVVYWRLLERYVVLTTADAFKLSQALSGKYERRGGRESAKEYLLRDRMFPVIVRTRSRQQAEAVIYRVDPGRGTTNAWKLEARLKGQSSTATTFSEADAMRVLDEILNGLVKDHGLMPIRKPARWEPRDCQAPLEATANVPDLRGLRASAFRGRKPPAVDLNTPWPLLSVYSAMLTTGCDIDPLIREGTLLFLQLSGMDVSSIDMDSLQSWIANHQVPKDIQGSDNHSFNPASKDSLVPWSSLSNEIIACPQGTVSEVILGPNESPCPFIRELASVACGTLSVSVLTAGDRRPDASGHEIVGFELGDVVSDHPFGKEMPRYWVQVIDYDTVVAVRNERHGRPSAMAVSERLVPYFAYWRQLAEATGLNIIIVSLDARPVAGRGPWRPEHNYRDTRVRSIVGDAGRYHCHMRYLVEGTNTGGISRSVAVIKDEVNGLGAGRIIWTRSGEADTTEEVSVNPDDLVDLDDYLNPSSGFPGGRTADELLDEILGNPEAED